MGSGRFSHILKGEEVERFLTRFAMPGQTTDNVLDEVRAVWGDKGFMTPAELKAEILERRLSGAEKPVTDFIRRTEIACNRPEPGMKFLGKEHAYLMKGLAHLYAVEMKQPVLMLTGDFSEMGKTNKYLRARVAEERHLPVDKVDPAEGMCLTDKAMSVVCASVTDNASRLFPASDVHGTREGGDEFSVYVIGGDGARCAELTGVTNAHIENHVARMGLSGGAGYKGFGAGVTTIDLCTVTDPGRAIQKMEGDILVNKHNMVLLRHGRLDAELMQAEIEVALDAGQLRVPDGDTRGEFITRQSVALAREARKAAHALRSLGPKRKGTQDFMSYIVEHTPLKLPPPGPPTVLEKDMTGEDRPAGLPPLASLARRRLVVAEDYLAGHGVRLDKARRGNLALALADLAPEDPAARTMMPQEMIRNIEMHAREGEEYRILHGLGGQSGSLAMGISFHGLGAFNAAFGHEIADLGLVHMGHGIIEEALHDAGVTSPDNYDIAHHGGGNFTVLVKPSATAPDEVQEKFSSAVASRVAEMNGRKIGDFLHEKDASIDPDAFAAESFATLRDKKRRTVRVDGQDFESRVDGIHAVVVGDVVPDRERLDGGAFISELRDRADAALDAYRAAHLERHLPVRPSRPPSSYPPRPLTLDEAREARIAEIRGGGDRVSLISDLVGRLSSPPPPPDSDPHNDGGGGGQMPNLRAPKMPTI